MEFIEQKHIMGNGEKFIVFHRIHRFMAGISLFANKKLSTNINEWNVNPKSQTVYNYNSTRILMCFFTWCFIKLFNANLSTFYFSISKKWLWHWANYDLIKKSGLSRKFSNKLEILEFFFCLIYLCKKGAPSELLSGKICKIKNKSIKWNMFCHSEQQGIP